MNIQEYKDLSNVTMADNFFTSNVKTQRLLHAAAGLVTETGELLESIEKAIDNPKHFLDPVNVKEELGDITWYLAIDMREFNYTIPLDSHENFIPVKLTNQALLKSAIRATIVATKIMDDLKRVVYYGKPFFIEDLEESTPEKIKEIQDFQRKHIERCKELSALILNISNNFSLSFADIFDTNIAKLRKRYGAKFDSHKALNRDLTAEYQILSQDNSNITGTTPQDKPTRNSVFNQ